MRKMQLMQPDNLPSAGVAMLNLLRAAFDAGARSVIFCEAMTGQSLADAASGF
jgi:hypothetical protein